MTVLDEREDAVERQVQRIPTFAPEQEDLTSQSKHDVCTPDPPARDATLPKVSASSVVETTDETPHVQVETEQAKEERLERQWKRLKVEVADLPDVYARLAKIKLTGRAQQQLCTSVHMNCSLVKLFTVLCIFVSSSIGRYDVSSRVRYGSSAL